MTTADMTTSMIGDFRTMTRDQQKQAATAVLKEMAASDARGAIEDAGFPPPSPGIADRLWTIVVSTLSLVVVLAVVGLVITLFVKAQGSTSSEVVLTVFTTTTAALIGLFVPSPAQGSARAGQGG